MSRSVDRCGQTPHYRPRPGHDPERAGRPQRHVASPSAATARTRHGDGMPRTRGVHQTGRRRPAGGACDKPCTVRRLFVRPSLPRSQTGGGGFRIVARAGSSTARCTSATTRPPPPAPSGPSCCGCWSQLGGFVRVRKYGLAAQVRGRRDTLPRSIQHDLATAPESARHRSRRRRALGPQPNERPPARRRPRRRRVPGPQPVTSSAT